ncbi:MAG: sugar phosphate isomerase/epimerase [Clostridia bacterium]|nr:sugar phosphate isomerase/epimerase [Clostridia bacterium]
MKTSTEIASAAKHIGEERAIELIAKAGFDAWDFSMFEMARFDYKNRCIIESSHPLSGAGYADFAKRLARIGHDFGIECNQSHAPFPVYCKEIRSYLKRAIECTAIAGGKICVIHPDNNKSHEENAEMFLELLPFAKECGVKIATENMWNWDFENDQVKFAACMTPESFTAHLDAVNDDSFIACLDLGHAEMRGTGTSAVELIHALGNRLGALHIHDNDKWHDSHAIPRSMDMDYDAIIKALKEIGYDGYFTFEADQHLSGFTADNIHVGIKELADSARELAEAFEKL